MSYMLPLPLHSTPKRLIFSVRQISSRYDRRRFVRFAKTVYRGDRYWAPGVIPEHSSALDGKKNPALAHIELGLFVAESRTMDDVIGTVAVWIDHSYDNAKSAKGIGFFGFFEVINEEEVASRLLETAEAWLQEHQPKATTLRGPVSLDPCRSPGLLTDGFNLSPTTLMPYNPPYYPELIATAGFNEAETLAAYVLELTSVAGPWRPVPATVAGEESQLRQARDLSLRPIDLQDLPAERAHFTRICEAMGEGGREARSSATGPCAGSDAEITSAFDRITRHCIPDLFLFAEEAGKPVAFAAALPDVNVSALRRLMSRLLPAGRLRDRLVRRAVGRVRVLPAAMLPAYRDENTLGLLYQEMARAAARLGYRQAEFAPILAGDQKANETLRVMGARPRKAFTIYEKEL